MTKKQFFILFLFSPLVVPIAIVTVLAKVCFETVRTVWNAA